MKNQISILTILVALIGLFVACQSSDSKAIRDAARQSLPKSSVTPAPTQQTPPAAFPSADSKISVPTTASLGNGGTGVQHYTCKNNCEGSGGGAAGTCPVCGEAYDHNQAWHNQQQTPTPTPNQTITPSNATATIPPAAGAEPPQNADGVWHYTCSAGCAGGGGSATACATCGATLVHNTAYH